VSPKRLTFQFYTALLTIWLSYFLLVGVRHSVGRGNVHKSKLEAATYSVCTTQQSYKTQNCTDCTRRHSAVCLQGATLQ
jgi:hypothetical protein